MSAGDHRGVPCILGLDDPRAVGADHVAALAKQESGNLVIALAQT